MAGDIVAPLEDSNAFIRRGDSVRVDVVVRTLNVGHFFPGGTVDAFDVWLELKAVDDQGRILKPTIRNRIVDMINPASLIIRP